MTKNGSVLICTPFGKKTPFNPRFREFLRIEKLSRTVVRERGGPPNRPTLNSGIRTTHPTRFSITQTKDATHTRIPTYAGMAVGETKAATSVPYSRTHQNPRLPRECTLLRADFRQLTENVTPALFMIITAFFIWKAAVGEVNLCCI